MRNIVVERLKQKPTSEQRVEIVERKGVGHPDYIADSIANQISIELSKEYQNRVGTILHHNIDKALLAAGQVENRFGGGIIREPMKLIIGDRATFSVGEVSIPVDEIAVETSKKWIRDNLRFVDPIEHIHYQVELRKTSAALQDIFERSGQILGANDTSAAVGYAPLTPTEKIVLKTERFLNSKEFKQRFPESGEDIKVMGLRINSRLDLTVAMAFVDRFVDGEEDYFEKKNKILETLQQFVDKDLEFEDIKIHLNTLDEHGRGVGGVYLTVLGTSADGADSGQVGRGNRVNGLISLNRPSSSEAAAGKNPVSHVGKIYNLLSFKIADQICKRVPTIREAYVWLLSEIGRRIDQPKVIAVQVASNNEGSINRLENDVREVIDFEMEHIQEFCKELINGKFSVC